MEAALEEKQPVLDELGRAYATGRRKDWGVYSAVFTVWIDGVPKKKS